jgi:hypothetical protein
MMSPLRVRCHRHPCGETAFDSSLILLPDYDHNEAP